MADLPEPLTREDMYLKTMADGYGHIPQPLTRADYYLKYLCEHGGGGGGTGPNNPVPPGGTAGQFLKKKSDIDGDYGWGDSPVPAGGTAGQFLKKNSGTEEDYGWGDSPIPPGGSAGQVLGKNSGEDGDVVWLDPSKSAAGSVTKYIGWVSGDGILVPEDAAEYLSSLVPAGTYGWRVSCFCSYAGYVFTPVVLKKGAVDGESYLISFSEHNSPQTLLGLSFDYNGIRLRSYLGFSSFDLWLSVEPLDI